MLRILKRALAGEVATNSYPSAAADPPDGFRGKPVIDFTKCTACRACAEACPTAAILVNDDITEGDRRTVTLNYGDCIFCGDCEAACPGAIHLSKEFELAVLDRTDLVTGAMYRKGEDGEYVFAEMVQKTSLSVESVEELGAALKRKVRRLFGRSLHIREVDAGSCNGCEVEITALNNPVYDIARFGVHFVASPRHADMLLVTGPVTRNMELALKQTYEATPGPRLVVAVGACAIGGGIFGESYASRGGVDRIIPVDAYIPGCPPRPEALIHGILLAIDTFARKARP